MALGECGLDKRIEIPLETQIQVFQQQLDLVKTTEKPIILHCVAAFQEIIAIKKDRNIQNKIFLETDTIEETIFDVYEKAATIKGIPIDEMKNKIFENFKSIFKP